MGLFGSNLFGTLWASWTCVTFSFTRLGKFTVIISSDRLSLFSFWHSHDADVVIFHAKLFLKLSFFKILFTFCCSAWLFFSTLLPKYWFDPLLHLAYCLFLPVYYLSQILHFLFLILYDFYVFFVAVECPYNHYSKYLMSCLLPFHLILLENSLILSFAVYFFVFPFWLLLFNFQLTC